MASLKQRYRGKWAKSNRRERFVLGFLKEYLPSGYEARLTGLGAGSTEVIPGGYRGVLDAFDITILHRGMPVLFIDVTGITNGRKAKRGIGFCVGEWKLEKAKRLRVEDRLWIAFVVDGESRILWAPAKRFQAPDVAKAQLYRDEKNVLCLPRRAWYRFSGSERSLLWALKTASMRGPVKTGYRDVFVG